jgi:hypothetical protein
VFTSPFGCLGDVPHFADFVVVTVALLLHGEVNVKSLHELWLSFEVFFNRNRAERFILMQAVNAPRPQQVAVVQLVVSEFVEQQHNDVVETQLALAQSWNQILTCDFGCLVVEVHCGQQETLFPSNLPLLLPVVSVISFSPFWSHCVFSLCLSPSELCSLWLWIAFPCLPNTFFWITSKSSFHGAWITSKSSFHGACQRLSCTQRSVLVEFQSRRFPRSVPRDQCELFHNVSGLHKFCTKQIAAQNLCTIYGKTVRAIR